MAQDVDQWRALVNGIEPSGSIKCSEVFERLRKCAAPQEGLSSVSKSLRFVC
jgi:hypothetical protein